LGEEGQDHAPRAFLAELDAVIPWSRLLALIEPHYPKAGNGTQPKPMEQMLRIYFMQN
jgi:IS5 family transposase